MVGAEPAVPQSGGQPVGAGRDPRGREADPRAAPRPHGGQGLGAARAGREGPPRLACASHRGRRAGNARDAQDSGRPAPGRAVRPERRRARAARRHAARDQGEPREDEMNLRPILLIGVPAALVAIGVAIWLRGGRYEETENAYVKAHIIAVTADVSGRVIEVGVRDNQPVPAGALLFRVDPAPLRLEVARAEAQMAVVRTELEGLRAEHKVALAEAAEAEERIRFLARQLERQEKLKERGMGLEASYDEARHNLEAARRRLDGAKER